MSTTQIEVNVRPEVRRGADWLDAVYPGWDKKIDLTTLNLFSCSRCVCGQLFGWEGPGPAGLYDEEYGFDVSGDIDKDEYAKLTEEWRDLIAARR